MTMRVIEAAIAGFITAVLLTFLVHRLHGNVDLVVLWVVTFLVMFVTVIVLPYSSRDRR
jgi:high-affinity Fe2+/Pb2+ permease